jgi:pilus assembly protein FimV
MMEFNLDDLSLDLDTPEFPSNASANASAAAANAPPPLPQLSDDPLATKLALAQEFNTIGDSDGARTLIEEVIAESSGELKARAQRLLSELD